MRMTVLDRIPRIFERVHGESAVVETDRSQVALLVDVAPNARVVDIDERAVLAL